MPVSPSGLMKNGTPSFRPLRIMKACPLPVVLTGGTACCPVNSAVNWLATAMPVSNGAQEMIERKSIGVEVLTNRGIGSDVVGAAGGVGANERFTVATPGGGAFEDGDATKLVYVPKSTVLGSGLGFVDTTSQTAEPVPLITWTSLAPGGPPGVAGTAL